MFRIFKGWLALLLAFVLASSSGFAAGIPTGAEDSFNRMNSIAFKYSLGTLIKQALGSAAGVALPSAQVYVGNGSGVATAVSLSGDVTMSNTGAVTIGANVVSGAKMVNNTVSFAQLDPAVAQYTASIALTQAQIQGLSVTPIQLIAAPGAGKLILVDEVEILHTYSTTQYANGGKLQVQFHGTTDILDVATAVVTAASSGSFVSRPSLYDVDNSTGTAPNNVTTFANLAVDLTNAVAPFINGNAANVLKIRVKYRIVTLLT